MALGDSMLEMTTRKLHASSGVEDTFESDDMSGIAVDSRLTHTYSSPLRVNYCASRSHYMILILEFTLRQTEIFFVAQGFIWKD